MRSLLRFGLRRPYLALIVPTLVVTAIFGWQAIESQQVKNALQPVAWARTRGLEGFRILLVANRGDMPIELEDAQVIGEGQLVGVVDGLVQWGGVDPDSFPRLPGGFLRLTRNGHIRDPEGFEIPPHAHGVTSGTFLIVRPGGFGGHEFDGVRINFHNDGRAGQLTANVPGA